VRKHFYAHLLRLSEIDIGAMLNEQLQYNGQPILEQRKIDELNTKVTNVLRIVQYCIDAHNEQYVLIDDNF
jgi:hypothetical protein